MNNTLLVSLGIVLAIWTFIGMIVLDNVPHYKRRTLLLYLIIGPLLSLIVGGIEIGEALAKLINKRS